MSDISAAILLIIIALMGAASPGGTAKRLWLMWRSNRDD